MLEQAELICESQAEQQTKKVKTSLSCLEMKTEYPPFHWTLKQALNQHSYVFQKKLQFNSQTPSATALLTAAYI